MFSRAHIYTVHVKEDAAPEDRVVLVREGFSIWAFAFSIFWLLYHKLWLMSIAFTIFNGSLMMAGRALGVSELTLSILQAGLGFWLGCVAHDAQRESLSERGYEMKDVAVAESETLAARRYFDRQPAH